MRYYGFQNELKAYLNRIERENGFRVSYVVAKSLNDRVEALKKSGIWKTYGLGFNDVDADAYFARANVTDIVGRAEILWFVRGMKALGLYPNMIAWPTRSYQNVGSGLMVYSLGGYSSVTAAATTYGPTWTQEGISFTAANQVVRTNVGASGNLTAFSVLRPRYISGTTSLFLHNRQSSSGGFSMFIHTSGLYFRSDAKINGSWGVVNTFGTPVANQFACVMFTHNSAAGQITTVNGTDSPLAANIGSLGDGTIGMSIGSDAVSFLNGDIAMSCLINRATTIWERSRIYSLYKQTLGFNLGLP